MMNINTYMETMGRDARQASRLIASASTREKNTALEAIADSLVASRNTLSAANEKDLQAGRERGLSAALLDRLELTPERISAMIDGLRQVAALADVCGEITDLRFRPSGIQVGRMRVPLGVVGIIYESRPNVTIEAAGLCLKSGNAAILRGGSESIHSNRAIADSIVKGLAVAGLSTKVVQVVETTDREAVGRMISMPEYVDVIVPRGGKRLIERIAREASVPVIKHLDGVCHTYIDDKADQEKAFQIALNAKTHRYGVCNAMETLLVAENIAETVLARLCSAYQQKGVKLLGCEKTCQQFNDVESATEEDWSTEYLAPILSIKIVKGLEEAIDHINRYGSQHTDAIVTEDYQRARRFLTAVDSSSVMVNASTRFADGFEYGLGAEIGISTDRIHARGPVGLEGLTSQKWVVLGDGHIRQ